MRDDYQKALACSAAGVVLGLEDLRDEGNTLLQEAYGTMFGTMGAFYAALRWATLAAKRWNDLEQARRLIEQAAYAAEYAKVADSDRMVMRAMTRNFEGLIAIRREDEVAAVTAMRESIALFGLVDRSASASAEESARYHWMALLNSVQLDIYSQRFKKAVAGLKELIAFAREFDLEALHASLSVLGYVFLITGRPQEALPPLLESHELLRQEYDLSVVLQVRKMLIRCFLELGREGDAQQVRGLSKFFWRESGLPPC